MHTDHDVPRLFGAADGRLLSVFVRDLRPLDLPVIVDVVDCRGLHESYLSNT